jgi:hypothetical protein
MNESTQTPKKRGCFFYGCLTLIVVLFLGVLTAVVVAVYATKKLSAMAITYTDTAPVQLEKVEVTPAELKAIEQRVATFQQALENQSQAQELTLSVQEINALIANAPSFKALKDKLFVSIDGNRIRGQVSWPLDDIGKFKLKGRYLNGEVAFRLSLANGRLGVYVDDLKVKGQPLPATLLTVFRGQNLAEGMQNDPETAARIQKFDSIKVEDGKLTLRNKAKP